MSQPNDQYESYSREQLENLLWQLQTSLEDFRNLVDSEVNANSETRLAYRFACPTQADADALAAAISEEADDVLGTEEGEGEWILLGSTGAFEFELGMLLSWVGFLCDLGNRFDCRFDGWTLADSDAQGGEVSADGEPMAGDDVDADIGGETGNDEDGGFPHFVIARIPLAIEPVERSEQFEDPLHAALGDRGLGQVVGGGSRLDDDGQIVAVEIEIALTDLEDALELTKEILRSLGAPPDSELHYAVEVVEPLGET